MATLTVWRFPTVSGAEEAQDAVLALQRDDRITLQDAAVVTWPVGARKPRTRQLHGMVGAGAFTGSFWGLLFGILFLVPVLGLAVGAALGALAGSLADVGIDDDFIAAVRGTVTPGTSALFLMTEAGALEEIEGAFAGTDVDLVSTNLSAEQESALREAFGNDDES